MSTILTTPEELVSRIEPGTHVIVPLANGEPVTIMNALEARAHDLEAVRVHQMHALHDRPTMHGEFGDRLRHISYFLSHITRPAFHAGTIDLVPCHFSEVPFLLRQLTGPKIVMASASTPDRHGYFTLGVNADYVAAFVGEVPFYLEANARMPRTSGRNHLHVTQIEGWVGADYPLIEMQPVSVDEIDRKIGEMIADRIPDGATIQAGIGSIPTSVLELLRDHRSLGIHTELLSDSVMDLFEAGAITGAMKVRRPHKMVTTFSLGTKKLYDFLDGNPAIEFLPVDWVNDARVIAQQPNMVSINATTEVDFLGQCASETIAGRYWSGSGGQADFARGARDAPSGQGFVVLQATARGGEISRITPRLTSGSAVTTLKNTVDKVVTEFGIAELRGRTIRERTRALIAIAHPKFRDELTRSGRDIGYL